MLQSLSIILTMFISYNFIINYKNFRCKNADRWQLLQTPTFAILHGKTWIKFLFSLSFFLFIPIYHFPIFLLQLRQWARLGFEGRERIVGLDFKISELKESLVQDSLASLVNGCLQLTLTGVDEEDFFRS